MLQHDLAYQVILCLISLSDIGSFKFVLVAITSQREIFYAKCEYSADLEDELSFPKGAEIEIINKSISGWWTGR